MGSFALFWTYDCIFAKRALNTKPSNSHCNMFLFSFKFLQQWLINAIKMGRKKSIKLFDKDGNISELFCFDAHIHTITWDYVINSWLEYLLIVMMILKSMNCHTSEFSNFVFVQMENSFYARFNIRYCCRILHLKFIRRMIKNVCKSILCWKFWYFNVKAKIESVRNVERWETFRKENENHKKRKHSSQRSDEYYLDGHEIWNWKRKAQNCISNRNTTRLSKMKEKVLAVMLCFGSLCVLVYFDLQFVCINGRQKYPHVACACCMNLNTIMPSYWCLCSCKHTDSYTALAIHKI